MTDWQRLSNRASFASHRLIGWIYWDPGAQERFDALGAGEGFLYSYVATRAAPLAPAGNQAVVAAFGSISPALIELSLDAVRTHTTFEAVVATRNAAVRDGLQQYVPEICDGLAAMRDDLWAAADAINPCGRVLFAAHRGAPRPEDPLISAWLAVNCIREFRGDTHWALHITEGLSDTASMILDGAWRYYEDDWLPKSRGADPAMVADGFAELEARGLAADGRVTQAGIDYRQSLEDRLDHNTEAAWRALGVTKTEAFLGLVEPVGQRLIDRIDVTAGPNWMPAGRERRPPTT